MRLVGYGIDDGHEVVVFKREHIDESGKMNCQYALWRDKDTSELRFGLLGPRGAVGVPVDDTVRRHIRSMIDSGGVDVCYKYEGASEEFGEGYLREFIPTPLCEKKALPKEVIDQLAYMLKEFVDPALEETGTASYEEAAGGRQQGMEPTGDMDDPPLIITCESCGHRFYWDDAEPELLHTKTPTQRGEKDDYDLEGFYCPKCNHLNKI